MSSANRLARVNELLKRELGFLCEREGIAVAGALITITGVKVSPDLRHGDVSVSVMGDEHAWQEVMRLFVRRRKRLQKELAERVKLKYTPVLRFHEDRTAATADRLLHILDDLDIPADDEEGE